MNVFRRIASLFAPVMVLAGLSCVPAAAQGPVPEIVPIVADTAVPIVINAVKPKPTGLSKFEGFVIHANIGQITVRAKGNDLSIQTFTLSQAESARMQAIIDKGGYQYGDKVTVMYDPASLQAIKIKGKPSRPI